VNLLKVVGQRSRHLLQEKKEPKFLCVGEGSYPTITEEISVRDSLSLKKKKQKKKEKKKQKPIIKRKLGVEKSPPEPYPI